LPALSLTIDDTTLSELITRRVNASDNYWQSEVKLWDRQKLLEKYLNGRQFDTNDFHPSEKPFMENVMWEAWIRNRSIIMSRIPDIEVGSVDTTNPEGKLIAEKIQQLVNTNLKTETSKLETAKVVMNRPIYFYGVMKAVWNAEKDDFEFISVNPKNVIIDHTVTSKGKMGFLCEKVRTTVGEVVMMFPDKADEFKEYYKSLNNLKDLGDNQLSSPIDIWEVWFDEYIKQGEKYEKVQGTVWMFKNVLLKKMKNPYWDWSGKKQYFVKEPQGVRPPTEDELYNSLFGDQEMEFNQVYNNYLKRPEFPYFICTLNNGNENAIDVTSDYEQIVYFQDNINREGVQISTMNSRSYGKDVYSADAFENEGDVSKIDPRNLDQVIKVKGEDVGKVFQHIDYAQASPQMYKSKGENRAIAFEMLSLNATTRGTSDTKSDTLGAKQMYREQDFGVLDYEASMTLNELVTWQAKWMMHFIKLFYKTSHYTDVMGEAGQTVRERFTNDMVNDGMVVKVSVSSVNKQKKYAQAVTDAQSGMSDPLSYFEDTEQENPQERAMRMFMFKSAPMVYAQQYLGLKAPAPVAPPPGEVPPEQAPTEAPPTEAPPEAMGGGNPDPLGLFT
jgi:hypothetical protein